MSDSLPIPPVPELCRAEGQTEAEVADWFVRYYNGPIVPWNYRTGTKVIKAAYRGLHDLDQLAAGCAVERLEVGRRSNEEIVRMAGGVAVGRSTQVFDLSPRSFSFGRDFRSAYRIPFFFVEGGIVKLYFLQPRRTAGLSADQLGMVATIYKKYLLETEFYGIPSDVEFVDLSVPEPGGKRKLTTYSMASLDIWPDDKLADRLSVVTQGLLKAMESGRIVERVRRRPAKQTDMPLFD